MMFEIGVVIVCLGLQEAPVACVTLRDSRGPYETLEACRDRSKVIRQKAIELLWPMLHKKFGAYSISNCVNKANELSS